jgi:hypothetical protein
MQAYLLAMSLLTTLLQLWQVRGKQVDIDMSAVESNHWPYQEWPMQKVWEEDETNADGLREKWQQVENLEDALTVESVESFKQKTSG